MLRFAPLAVLFAALCSSASARAQRPFAVTAIDGPLGDPADRAEDEDQEAASEEPTLGFTAGVGVASAYVFRGLNLLQATSQRDQHAVVQPSLTYDVPWVEGLSLSYFASYQVAGSNRAEMVAAGSGDEQDLTVAFSRPIGDVEVSASIAAYVYPFADREVAGTDAPTYLEPMAGVTWATAVDLGLAASLMTGLQDAIRPSTYLYLNPTVGRSFQLADAVSLDAGAGYGFKLQRATDNVHDVAVNLGLTFVPAARLDVTPGVHWAWTDIEGRAFADQQVVWGSVDVAVRL
jgi:hypothetical protein